MLLLSLDPRGVTPTSLEAHRRGGRVGDARLKGCRDFGWFQAFADFFLELASQRLWF